MTELPDPTARGEVVVDQSGPFDPPVEAVRAAVMALAGAIDVEPPCMDCAPDLVLKDYICPDCGGWEWGLLVLHDETCPAFHGVVGPAQPPQE